MTYEGAVRQIFSDVGKSLRRSPSVGQLSWGLLGRHKGRYVKKTNRLNDAARPNRPRTIERDRVGFVPKNGLDAINGAAMLIDTLPNGGLKAIEKVVPRGEFGIFRLGVSTTYPLRPVSKHENRAGERPDQPPSMAYAKVLARDSCHPA